MRVHVFFRSHSEEQTHALRSHRFDLASLVGSFALAACGGDDAADADPFDTFGACYDEHHDEEALRRPEGDRDLLPRPPDRLGQDANVVCGADSASCVTYVSAQSAPPARAARARPTDRADIQAACTDYQTQKGM